MHRAAEQAWQHQYTMNSPFILVTHLKTLSFWTQRTQPDLVILFRRVDLTKIFMNGYRVHLAGSTMRLLSWRLPWPCSTFPVLLDQRTLQCVTSCVLLLWMTRTDPTALTPTIMLSISSSIESPSSSISRQLGYTSWFSPCPSLETFLGRGLQFLWIISTASTTPGFLLSGWSTGKISWGKSLPFPIRCTAVNDRD